MRQTWSIEDLIKEQEMLERSMHDSTAERFQNQVQKMSETGRGSLLAGNKHVIDKFITPLAAMIDDYVHSKNSILPDTARCLSLLPSEHIAVITLRGLFDVLGRKSFSHSRIINRIGTLLEAEVAHRWYHKENPGYYDEVRRTLSKVHLEVTRTTKKVRTYFNNRGYTFEHWGRSLTLKVGNIVVAMLEKLKVINSYSKRQSNKKNKRLIELDINVLSFILKKQEQHIMLQPLQLPCVVEPQDWNTGFEGGYWFSNFNPQLMVSGSRKDQMEHFQKHASENIYRTINTIQKVPWRINQPVMRVQKALWDAGGYNELFPNQDDEKQPAKPEGMASNPELLKEWKRSAYITHKNNIAMRSKRLMTWTILNLAERFEKYEAIYFPHRYCFRSRLYPMPAHLQPQGCDQAKGLLEFQRGKSLGGRGLYWLAIHGANLYGNDKGNMDDRFAWAVQETEQLRALANNPLKHIQYLASADKPWQFLAFALEWTAAHALDNPEEFISHIPVAVDGTCNGLQHLSAMMKDPVGGQAVNLLPAETPQDIYQQVADSVNELLRDTNRPDDAKWLEFGIDRKICKRAVMVLPYGGTFHSCMDYTVTAVTEKMESKGITHTWFNMDSATFRKELARLAQYIWQATHENLPCAKIAMSWLQESAKILSNNNKPIFWSTPMGFPVWQSYRKYASKPLYTRLFGKQLRFYQHTATPELDKKRQVSAISPNFVHSLDAACMQLTVCTLTDAYGLQDFHMVHDSYGVHACDIDRLNAVLRDCFISIHEKDPLKQLKEELEDNTEVQLPDLPQRGNLELSQVRNSEFFFA